MENLSTNFEKSFLGNSLCRFFFLKEEEGRKIFKSSILKGHAKSLSSALRLRIHGQSFKTLIIFFPSFFLSQNYWKMTPQAMVCSDKMKIRSKNQDKIK